MSNFEMWSLIIGSVLPPFIAIVQQPRWADWLRATVTVVVCIAVGFGTAWFSGNLDGKDIVTSILITLVAALSTYSGFWKRTGVSEVIELRTSRSQSTDGAIA